MRLNTVTNLIVVVLIAAQLMVVSAAHGGSQTGGADKNNADPITGEWEATFELQGTKVPATLKLKLDTQKVTGTIDSQHTGPGTLSKGSWADNKLEFTVDFAAHESIVISGSLKYGKLAGEFATEGMRGTWVAVKK